MLIAVKSKRFSVTGYKRMFVILIKKTLGSGLKYSTFDYCDNYNSVLDKQEKPEREYYYSAYYIT